jgi:hypothetical protein
MARYAIFQAITTRYIGPTNHRGSRVKATAAAGSIIMGWDSSLGSDENHAKAAEALANKFKWRGAWFGGGMPNGRGNVFVCVSARDFSESLSFNAAFTTQGEG